MTIDDLVKACEKGQVDKLTEALDNGVDINCAASDGWTPLRAAAAFANLDLVKLLLARGAKVDGRSTDGTTPLFEAARRGDFATASFFVESGADVNARNLDGKVPLNPALTNRRSDTHVEVIKLFLSRGARVDVKGYCGRTPLHQAAANNNIRGAKLLLRYGADVNALDENGCTPLQLHLDEDRGEEGLEMDDLLRAAVGATNSNESLHASPYGSSMMSECLKPESITERLQESNRATCIRCRGNGSCPSCSGSGMDETIIGSILSFGDQLTSVLAGKKESDRVCPKCRGHRICLYCSGRGWLES